MSRNGLWTEMLTAPAALVLVLAAALLGARALLLLLPVLWLAPAAARRLTGEAALDEREAVSSLHADRVSLVALLATVSVLAAAGPGPGGPLEVLGSEWADSGLLVVAVFYLRTLYLSWHTMDRRVACHLAGGTGALTLSVLALGTLAARPGAAAPWILVAPLLALMPHLLLRSAPVASLALWAAGAALAVAVAAGGGFLWIESLVVVALLGAPWAAATVACAGLLASGRPAEAT